MFGVGDSDFEIGASHIALEAEQILPKNHLNRLDDRLKVGELTFKEHFEGLHIILGEGNGSSHVKVMEEVCHM